MKSGYLSPAKPRFLAHRGLTVLADGTRIDENTIPAFAAAVAVGAKYLETDVQCSSDGVPFAFHDGDLTRVLGLPSPVGSSASEPGEKRIEHLTSTEIAGIRLAHGSQIPTLRQVLESFPNARFNLDIKSEAAIAPTASVINELGCFDRVLVSSFSGSRRRAALRLIARPVATSADRDLVVISLVLVKLGLGWFVKPLLKGIDACQVPTEFAGVSLTNRRFVRAVKRADVELHYWTVNDPKRMRDLLALGADGIVTDRIDLALSL